MEEVHNITLFDFYFGRRLHVNGLRVTVGMCVGTGSFFAEVGQEQKYATCITQAKNWIQSKLAERNAK
jgi:hypothetical protein